MASEQAADRQATPGVSTVWLVRHGQRMDVDPAWKPRRCHHTEVPLSPLGHSQADALGRRLATAGIEHLFCSPYLRAVQTAVAVARHTGLPIKVEHGVMEWQNIAWFPASPPLESVASLATQYPALNTGYRSRVQPTWPETLDQNRQRLRQTIKQLVRDEKGPILVVGHGATVVGMARALLSSPEQRIADALCGIVQLQFKSGQWRLEMNGETTHLEGGTLLEQAAP